MKYPANESATLEFKKDLPKNDQLIKTAIGFCNQKGGEIIIGVDDTGTIVGLPEEKISHILEYLDQSIYEASMPTIIPRIYSQRFGNKTVVIVKVSEGMNKPYFVKSDGVEKGTYIRLGRSTMPAKSDTIEELKLQSLPRSFSYDSMPVYHASLDELDLDKFREFLAARRHAPQGPVTIQEALRSYQLVTDEHGIAYPTVAGILLFGKDPQRFFPDAYIVCSEFAGIAGRHSLATTTCTGTLFDQYYKAYTFVTDKLSYAFTIKGARRKETLEVPEVALRETIVNALAHRNYHAKSPTKIAIYDNRIEIFSPGDFPGQITPDSLRAGMSIIRNYAITKVFHAIGYIEKLGSGINAIFESYEERGLEEPAIIEGENYVKCILPRPSSKKVSMQKDIDGDSARVLRLFKTSGQLSISDVIEQLHLNRTAAARKLAILVKKGLIKKTGKGRATRYFLK
jgi:ATP-dependent DNA helicase RecG